MEEAYSERYTKVLRRSTIVKVEEIKKIIYNLFGEIKYKHMMSLLSRCAHYHYYKKRKLGTKEIMLYDVLIKYGYNPYRVYKWFRIAVLPEDITNDIQQGTLNRENALKIHTNRMRTKEISMNWRFMEEARRIVRGVII